MSYHFALIFYKHTNTYNYITFWAKNQVDIEYFNVFSVNFNNFFINGNTIHE